MSGATTSRIFGRTSTAPSTVAAWNSTIRAAVDGGRCLEAVQVYGRMRGAGAPPDNLTFPFVANACGRLSDERTARAVHAHVAKSPFCPDVFVQTALVDMYLRCGHMGSARDLFDEMPERDVAAWNVMMAGFVQMGCLRRALDHFLRMRLEGFVPDSITILLLTQACAVERCLQAARRVHCLGIQMGIGAVITVANTWISAYSKCGDLCSAELVFREISLSHRTIVSWNSMIAGYGHLGRLNDAIVCFCKMCRHGIRADLSTCVSLISLFAHSAALLEGGEESTINLMETQVEIGSSTPLLEVAYANVVVEHPFPLNCLLKDWSLGPHFYQAVKIGIVQYMILKTVCAFLAIILELCGVYGEGKFEWKYGYPYLAVVLNFSQTWALYCLVQFYSVTKEKLEAIKPLAKFLVFKSIVFLTWWQGVIVAFLFSLGFFKSYLAQELKTRIQDYIICIEMGVAAVVHFYVFPAKPYQRGERCIRNVAVMTDYASLDSPPDPEEVRDSERTTRVRLARPEDREKRFNFPQSVRDVVVGSGEIMVDDVKFTVSHVVQPVERGIARINETFHQISENVKQHEQRKKKAKDDCYLVPMNSKNMEFSEIYDQLPEGSVSDSGLARRRPQASTRSS